MTITEIDARMAAIGEELRSATGDALTALETEVTQLEEQRAALEREAASRTALIARVTARAQSTPTVSALVQGTATPAAAPAQSAEEREMHALADYVRGIAPHIQSRANEQNIDMTNAADLLPTTIAQRVITEIKERCPVLAGADIYHVKGTLKIPTYGAKTVSDTAHDITVGYATEFAELTADSGAFDSVDLTGYLVGALTLIGRSVINSADIDVVTFVVGHMADKCAAFIERELLVGTENKCTGALATTNTINAGSVSAISADNLIELQARIPSAYQDGACWTMNPATFTAIKKLKDGNGQYLVSTSFADAFPYRLLGKPVYLSDNMPVIASAAKAVLYGDYSGMAVNMREDIGIEILREKYATQHAIGVNAWFELDSKIQNAQKLATLTMSVG